MGLDELATRPVEPERRWTNPLTLETVATAFVHERALFREREWRDVSVRHHESAERMLGATTPMTWSSSKVSGPPSNAIENSTRR